ncbi:MAG: hypothetical protein SGCHY_005118 [Lobulomycetales sp.]
MRQSPPSLSALQVSAVPFSLLDNDLYKFGMQQAVLKVYPQAVVSYEFKNRKPADFQFSAETVELLSRQLENLKLSKEEASWLKSACPYFSESYIEYLKSFRFNPDKHVDLIYSPETKEVHITITGNWSDTILYEVPLLALVSESYYDRQDKDWNHDLALQSDAAFEKGKRLIQGGCCFSEFGTRRRRNAATQEVVVAALLRASQCTNGTNGRPGRELFSGTSNVYLAKKYDLTPIGTVAHEWTMAVSGLEPDLLHANKHAMEKWLQAYPSDFLIMLCDTFGTPAFLNDFSRELADKFLGVRQDSGNPEIFVDRIVKKYQELLIDTSTKVLVFSDSLTVEKALSLQAYVDSPAGGGIQAKQYGIGTYLTNDFTKQSRPEEKSPAVNIVIKLLVADGANVVKLSDDPGKHQGDTVAIAWAKKVFGME